jgi:transcriptional regulator with XRE-family HTH domain
MFNERVKQKRAGKSATGVREDATPADVQMKHSSAIANRIRARRRQLSLTLDDLSRKAGLDKGFLSRVERGQKLPSIGTLMRIASALDIQMAQLFGEVTAPDAITVVRRDRAAQPPVKVSATTFDVILPPDGRRRLSAYLITPDRDNTPEAADHPGDEMIYVLSGSLAVTFADRTVELYAGDCVHFDGHLKHRIRRTSRGVVQAVVIVATDLERSRA